MKTNQIKPIVSATPSVKQNTVFAFKKRAPIAAAGLNHAVWKSAINETPQSGDDFNIVVVSIEVKPKGANDPSFLLQKKYNIKDSGRGASAFVNDYNSWTGANMTEDDLYDSFDGEADKGKELVVEIRHRKVGKNWEAFIHDFHPAGYTEPVVEPADVAATV